MWNWLSGNLVATLFKTIILISPALREALLAALKELEKVAAGTDNKWDDILVSLLKTVLGVEEAHPAVEP